MLRVAHLAVIPLVKLQERGPAQCAAAVHQRADTDSDLRGLLNQLNLRVRLSVPYVFGLKSYASVALNRTQHFRELSYVERESKPGKPFPFRACLHFEKLHLFHQP